MLSLSGLFLRSPEKSRALRAGIEASTATLDWQESLKLLQRLGCDAEDWNGFWMCCRSRFSPLAFLTIHHYNMTLLRWVIFTMNNKDIEVESDQVPSWSWFILRRSIPEADAGRRCGSDGARHDNSVNLSAVGRGCGLTGLRHSQQIMGCQVMIVITIMINHDNLEDNRSAICFSLFLE